MKTTLLSMVIGFFSISDGQEPQTSTDIVELPSKSIQWNWEVADHGITLINQAIETWPERLLPENTPPSQEALFHTSIPEMMYGRSGQVIQPVLR